MAHGLRLGKDSRREVKLVVVSSRDLAELASTLLDRWLCNRRARNGMRSSSVAASEDASLRDCSRGLAGGFSSSRKTPYPVGSSLHASATALRLIPVVT